MWIFHINLIFLCPSQTKSHAFRPGDLEGHNPRLVNRSTRTPYKSAIEMLAFWSVEMCFMKYRTFIRPFRKIAKIDYQLRHVCSSVLPFAWNISVLTGRVFMESDIWVFFFENLSRNFKFNCSMIRKKGTVHGNRCTSMILPRSVIFIFICIIIFILRNVSDKSYRENQTTVYVQYFFFFLENRVDF